VRETQTEIVPTRMCIKWFISKAGGRTLAVSALAISGATVVVAAIRAPPVKTSPKYFRRLLEALLLLRAAGPPAVCMRDGSIDKEFTGSIEERRHENAATKNGSDGLIILDSLLRFPGDGRRDSGTIRCIKLAIRTATFVGR
jgi:hypothetical protein